MAGRRRTKTHFTETEAAEELGVSVSQFRELIRQHVTDQAEELENVPRTAYQASDLLILKLITGKSVAPDF